MTYEMTIAGLKRQLPLCKVTDDLYIGAFVIFGDADLTVGVSYLEKKHEWVQFNPSNATVNFMIRGGARGFYGIIGVSFVANDFSVFSPVIGFSWIS